ncbi:HipA domain-containing protein [Azospirillum sp. TSO22-1]|uniref:HipA domain-containing protein n=1 Tax=Azospirillum sp. TSO22-1 TaxID=716789 RepID=UPI001304927C|nr:HipA domain-containing protein [Azospirillum sp. TSO22-1]
MKVQRPEDLLDIRGWTLYGETPYHPVGARPKSIYIAPGLGAPQFIIPHHRYIFKLSSDRHPIQFWSEIFSYQFGAMIGVEVPPAFVALNSETGEVGSLLEFFYGAPGDVEERFSEGGDALQALNKDFDRHRGKQHNVRDVMRICKAFHALGVAEPSRHWAKVFTFDALIGNTDRHQDNWGILWKFPKERTQAPSARFAPAFDNGTSLGYDILEHKLAAKRQRTALEAYVLRGYHHMRWSRGDEHQCRHMEMLERIINAYPETKEVISETVTFDIMDVAKILHEMERFEVQPVFTRQRTNFVLDVIALRQRLIAEVVTGGAA